MSLAADEKVAIVDEQNNVVRAATRKEMRENNLIHRATYIFVLNSKKQFYVQKRTMLKDYCPGYFDPVSGGCVQHGESYEENAYRELEEEMGIKGEKLTHMFTFFHDGRSRVWGDAWYIEYDIDPSTMTLQEEEVESVHLMTLEEIRDRVSKGENFTPDGMEALEHYEKWLKQQ
eukprot:GFYU01015381.1.p1 GENE.GFYU01015381.1~~GFYU01015381.1.p1  ORF type:complete len:174 (+),score=62.31 GFYU01015381.1:107-628(+)